MTVYHSRKYLCNFCPATIEKEEDGIVLFGTIASFGARGLKTLVGGDLPTDTNYSQLGLLKTCICSKCLRKKFSLFLSTPEKEQNPKSDK